MDGSDRGKETTLSVLVLPWSPYFDKGYSSKILVVTFLTSLDNI